MPQTGGYEGLGNGQIEPQRKHTHEVHTDPQSVLNRHGREAREIKY